MLSGYHGLYLSMLAVGPQGSAMTSPSPCSDLQGGSSRGLSIALHQPQTPLERVWFVVFLHMII